ncbi:MAG: hypothetical protein J0L73_28300 [Verrucomicrobia bacterium]|nr:hypothetical protein [Verrucomicrobiota bacterium]
MKTLLILYLLTSISTFAAELHFSDMEDGDRVEVTLHSTGCFHNSISYYEARKSRGTFFFTEYAITWDKKLPSQIAQKKVVAELQLAPKDIDALDGLLRYFRAKREGSSTTQISLLVEYYEGGRPVKVEQLYDGSGGYGDQNKDMTAFYQLTSRLHP